MPRTGLAYERPSLVSLALIACFSLAVFVMAGWLVMTIVFSNDANTRAADPAADPVADAADVAALTATSAAQAGNALPSYAPPGAGPPSAAGAATAALGGPAPEMTYRGPGDLLNFPPDADDASRAAVPLPPPRPRRTASVPVPRPRPPIDGGDAPAPPERSLFDIFVRRQQ